MKSAVSQMRMLMRGRNPFFGKKCFPDFRQEPCSWVLPERSFLAENISDTPRGVDELGVAGVALDLLAEVTDVYVYRALVPELVAPHPGQQRAARKHPAGVGGQRHEKLEL